VPATTTAAAVSSATATAATGTIAAMEAIRADVSNRGAHRVRLTTGAARMRLRRAATMAEARRDAALVLGKTTIEGLLKRVDIARHEVVVVL
jgi:hypothetical protein